MAASRSPLLVLRSLRWTTTVLTGAAIGVVAGKVVGCLGDELCTFAPGALRAAVLAFVGGPLVVMAVWLVPALQRRGWFGGMADGWVGKVLVASGGAAIAAGIWTLRVAGPAGAVLPAVGPGLIVTGLLAAAGWEAQE